MTPALTRLLVLAAVLLALTGGVVAWAASSGTDVDPAPPAATRDVPGVVSIAQPIAAIPVGSTPPGSIELRVVEPDGTRLAVLAFRETRTSSGRKVDRRCALLGREVQLRALEEALGNCHDRTGTEPWSISTSASSEGSVTVGGVASERVRRLTIAGPGGTFVVPISPGGAFLVAYGRRATGRAVITATLDDGTTRFFRTEVPPSFRSPGAVLARDPEGLPDWYTTASLRDRGARKGQTCAQVVQQRRIRAAGLKAGGTFLAPACGDLARAPLFARTVTTRPSASLGTFGGGRNVPRRTVLVGAARKDVKSVSLTGPSGRQALKLADASRAFLAVLPASVRPAQLTLKATLADGRTERYANPVAVNRATTENPPPRLLGRPTLELEGPGTRRATLRVRLAGTANRVEATLLGREIRLRRAGPGTTYQGVYDGNRGARRRLVRGSIQPFSLVICGDTCSTQLQRVRAR